MNAPIEVLLERKGSLVHAAAPTTLVIEAVTEMNRHRVGCLVILDGSSLAGIFTERDVLRRVVGAGMDPRRCRVRDVMTLNVITAPPDATIEETLAIFTEKRFRHLPVVAGDRLVGIVSLGDISRWMVDNHRAEAEHLKNYIAGGFMA